MIFGIVPFPCDQFQATTCIIINLKLGRDMHHYVVFPSHKYNTINNLKSKGSKTKVIIIRKQV
jgi:hypothetical protein